MFYGRANAEERGETHFYNRAHGSEYAQNDPFALKMEGNANLEGLYLNAERDDGYIRDQSVFGDGISIEDTMGVMVRYESGAILTYSLVAYAPVEGLRAVVTGTKGRIEVNISESVYVNAAGDQDREGLLRGKSVMVYPMFDAPYQAELEERPGGHGGADPVILNDLFGVPEHDPLNRAASHVAGAASVIIGVAANHSMNSGLPVKIRDLMEF
jgi:hypothetical protein